MVDEAIEADYSRWYVFSEVRSVFGTREHALYDYPLILYYPCYHLRLFHEEMYVTWHLYST